MKIIAAVSAMLILGGCSGGTEAASNTRVTPTVIASAKPAGVIIAAMRAKIPQATALHIWTAENDPNQLMGRPGQYVTSATMVDKRTKCTDPAPGVDCGATVEVFGNEQDAQQRAQFIASMLDGAPMLGTEYHTVVGSVLLRVTGKLPPAQNEVYAAAFRSAL